MPDLVALGLPALHLKGDEFGHVRVREDPVATPAADFQKAQCLPESHQVIEAHVGAVSAPDSRKEKVWLHTADVTERVRQGMPRQAGRGSACGLGRKPPKIPGTPMISHRLTEAESGRWHTALTGVILWT
jgi:hypothetical protein